MMLPRFIEFRFRNFSSCQYSGLGERRRRKLYRRMVQLVCLWENKYCRCINSAKTWWVSLSSRRYGRLSLVSLVSTLDDDSRREWQQPRLMKTDETAERLGDLSWLVSRGSQGDCQMMMFVRVCVLLLLSSPVVMWIWLAKEGAVISSVEPISVGAENGAFVFDSSSHISPANIKNSSLYTHKPDSPELCSWGV
jgi:hypothetical protein